MDILLVTEKFNPATTLRDGGARLVETLLKALGKHITVMQFSTDSHNPVQYHFEYPNKSANRFERRLANANFIANHVKAVEHRFTHFIFIHISMQFGLFAQPLSSEKIVWTFPMFLTPSYEASGENIPSQYREMERQVLLKSKHILTPSYLEKQQLIDDYSVSEKYIHVVPRGVVSDHLTPSIRHYKSPLTFCSVGSIKSQKNTLGLIRLFDIIKKHFTDARLQIIGPIQNESYGEQVKQTIASLSLENSIEMTGYIPPHQLSHICQHAHFHLSTSLCETFGRAIFETLACGIPNIVTTSQNAAKDYLEDLPYAKFIDISGPIVSIVKEMLTHLPVLSSMAMEVRDLFDDQILAQLLVAKICERPCMGIFDFDGTLYHKNDPQKTMQFVEKFRQFPCKVICSARPILDLLDQLKNLDLEVDWIIGCSGAITTDGKGNVIHTTPLEIKLVRMLENTLSDSRRIEKDGQILQIATKCEHKSSPCDIRKEAYQGITYINNWKGSKLHAIHRLLRHIHWQGQVKTFGDGPHDKAMITFFNGVNVKMEASNGDYRIVV